MERGVKKYLKHKAVKDFAVRTGVFTAILFALQMGIMIFLRHTYFFRRYLTIPSEFYFDFLSGLSKARLLNSLIFIAIAFLIYIRRDLLKFKHYKQDWKETALWGVAAVVVFILHYVYKYLIRENLGTALDYSLALTAGKTLFNLGFIVLLAYAVYGKSFLHGFLSRFWKTMLAFGALAIVYYFLIELFQRIWFVMSLFVSKVIYFLLSLTYEDALIHVQFGEAPTIGAANFIVGVSKDCSGIDSLLLFLSLFIFLWVLNRHDVYTKKMVALFTLGVVGTIAYNLLRVYLIMLVGIHYDPRFAIDVFHTNAGWIMFLLFFGVFWHFGSKWVFLPVKTTRK